WPCARRGKDLGIEHSVEQVRIEQHRQCRADQHRQNQVAAVKKKRDTDWYKEAVGRTKCCGRNVALCEVLHVNGAVTSKERQRDSRQNHRNQRADNRRVRCHPELQNQLDANDRTEDRENDQQREGCGGECRGVRLIGRVVFGVSLDVGHFLVPVSGRRAGGLPTGCWGGSFRSAPPSRCHPRSPRLGWTSTKSIIVTGPGLASKPAHPQPAMPNSREMGGPGRSHSASFDHLRRPEAFRTAMATAFFCPTNTTSRLPRVTP